MFFGYYSIKIHNWLKQFAFFARDLSLKSIQVDTLINQIGYIYEKFLKILINLCICTLYEPTFHTTKNCLCMNYNFMYMTKYKKHIL